MPRIIVKCRYIKSAPVHRSNLVDYIATREGVDTNIIGTDRPVTHKQKELITELLRAAPDACDMYADGLGRDADAEAARDWYEKALAGFLAVESMKPKPYIQYRIGKIYAAGLGTEQNYSQAADWFAQAVEKNHNLYKLLDDP